MRHLTLSIVVTLDVLLGSAGVSESADRQRGEHAEAWDLIIGSVGVMVWIGAVIIYLLPTIIAVFAGHERKGMIFFLNLCLGWTGLGWLFLVIYAAGFIGDRDT